MEIKISSLTKSNEEFSREFQNSVQELNRLRSDSDRGKAKNMALYYDLLRYLY